MGHTHSHGESHSAKEHKSHAPVQVATYVVTCSDSRSSAADESGRAIQDALRAAGLRSLATAWYGTSRRRFAKRSRRQRPPERER